jgi:hypothetical protein
VPCFCSGRRARDRDAAARPPEIWGVAVCRWGGVDDRGEVTRRSKLGGPLRPTELVGLNGHISK